MALGLKHGGAPEPHWPGPMHPPERRVRPLPSPGQGVPTPPQRAIVGLKGSVKHPASGSLGKHLVLPTLAALTLFASRTVITRVVIACSGYLPSRPAASRAQGRTALCVFPGYLTRPGGFWSPWRVFAEPVNEPNGQELWFCSELSILALAQLSLKAAL